SRCPLRLRAVTSDLSGRHAWWFLDVDAPSSPPSNLSTVGVACSVMARSERTRCAWAGSDPLYVSYHDREWGVPVAADRLLFDFLVLEGAQAGLSWITILRKRDAYRRAFDGFDPEKVARYDKKKVASLLGDAGIVRNRMKIESAVKNARAFLDVI